jgi:glycosyltransferase involved in cell wall biosynthesis
VKVLLVHRHDFGRGGGNIAMARLHRALRASGVDSRILCDRKVDGAGEEGAGEDVPPESVEIPRSRWTRRAESVLERIFRPLGLNDLHAVSSFGIPRTEAYREADVLDFHCIHGGFFNFLALPRLARDKAAVMTLHDMWPLTGHCHASLDCRRWRTGCGECPYPEVYPPVERDATALEWRLKDWTYGRCSFRVVAPSRWLGAIAEESMLGRFPVSVVPHGLDLRTYRPRDGAERRRELGIPDDRTVLMAAGLDLTSRLKGADLLVEAMGQLPREMRRSAVLVLMGRRSEELEERIPMEVISTGYLRDDLDKARTYAAADIFVHPSRAENYPLVLLESLACGTPMAAFSVGGVPELVRPGETGALAPPGDAGALAERLSRLLDDEELRGRMSAACRERAEAEHDVALQARRYRDVYRAALDEAA